MKHLSFSCLANKFPEVSTTTKRLNATVNEVININALAFDPEGNVTLVLIGPVSGTETGTNNITLTRKWTPSDINPVNLT